MDLYMHIPCGKYHFWNGEKPLCEGPGISHSNSQKITSEEMQGELCTDCRKVMFEYARLTHWFGLTDRKKVFFPMLKMAEAEQKRVNDAWQAEMREKFERRNYK